MTQKARMEGITFPDGQTGSTFLRQVMAQALEQFPGEFSGLELPSEKVFKKQYSETVVRFEAARVASPRRSEIARFIVNYTHDQLVYKTESGSIPWRDYIKGAAPSVTLETHEFKGKPGLLPSVTFHGRAYQGASLPYLGQKLLSEQKITGAVAKALNWVQQFAKNQGGTIDLSGQKFVILGASAELAPTPLLLQAGASVLWIDVQAPDAYLAAPQKYAGSLSVSPEAKNILLQPREIKAAIEAFAAGEPVHVAMFAYAAGASQEWRLAATMNALVMELSPQIVGSVSMLISPTSAATVQPEDFARSLENKRKPPLWQSALKTIGALGASCSYDQAGIPIARAIVPLQGASYQAAQYISKTLAAEVLASYGVGTQKGKGPLRVSANVAGITKTKSLQHPVFQAAFLGAEAFGVEIFEVPCTRALSTLLMLHDLFNPEAFPKTEMSQIFAQQVHGGIYSRAFALDPMIRIATMMGLVKQPQLLLKLM